MDKRYQKQVAQYWREMERAALQVLSRLDYSKWFDLWHTHPDWKGRGNQQGNRPASVELGLKLLREAETLSANAPRLIQAWLLVCADSSDDAVYLHSESPNGTPFPYSFEGAEWESEVHPLLNQFVDRKTHNIGKIHYEDEVVFVVAKRSP